MNEVNNNETNSLQEKRLHEFLHTITQPIKDIEDDIYGYINPRSNDSSMISMLIDGIENNRIIKKEKFLSIVRSHPDYFNSTKRTDHNKEKPVYEFVANKVNILLEQTKQTLDEQLSQVDDSIKLELKGYLYEISKDRIAGFIDMKWDTIGRWFTRNTPSRPKLFLLSFALDLPLTNPENKYFTHESLFYRAFGQRSTSRNPSELCMMYCKNQGLDYATALRLYLRFLLSTDEWKKKKNSEIEKIEKDKVPKTSFLNNQIKEEELSEDAFVQMLIDNTDTLNNYYFGIERIIEEIENDIGQSNEGENYHEKVYERYKLLLDSLRPIKKPERKRIPKGTHVTGAFPSINDTKSKNDEKTDKEQEYFSKDSNTARAKRYAQLKQYAMDVLVFSDYFHRPERYSQEYYIQQRKRLIFMIFLAYWEKCKISDGSNYKRYILLTNTVLTNNYFSKLLPYNDFDYLFILCSKRPRPLKALFSIQKALLNMIYEVTGKNED